VGVEVLGEGAPKRSALMPAPAVMSEGARAALVVRTVIEGGAWSSTLAARSLPASMGECPYREGEKSAVIALVSAVTNALTGQSSQEGLVLQFNLHPQGPIGRALSRASTFTSMAISATPPRVCSD
jgi:hypothetical protein